MGFVVEKEVMFALLRQQSTAVSHILTHWANLTFGPKSGFKNKWLASMRFRARAQFGLEIMAVCNSALYVTSFLT